MSDPRPDPAETWSIDRRLELLKERAEPVYVPKPPFPTNLMVELSNTCNHACVFCANPKMTRRRRLIDGPLVRSLMAQARALGACEIGFYTTGDPFVHKDLERYVREAKRLGYTYTYVSTNGALATPARSQAVIDAGLDSVKFSINAGSRASYRAIHGKDDWDATIANLRFISEYRKGLGRPLKLAITYVVIPQNRHECEPFRAAFAPLVDDIRFQDVDLQQGNMPENLEFLAAESTATPMQAPCYMPFSRAHITCEGYLTLCCVDYQNYLAVADLNVLSLQAAWEHPAFVAMRERHLRNELAGTLCWNCIHQQRRPIQPLVPALATPLDVEEAAQANLAQQRRRLTEAGSP